ncbi:MULTISPECIES: hypothetical protein [Stenotrophomonas]|uniref:hypothetical protein n=1 Tax=Stenotrophomonas TaxID=40323 RepID=UPI0008722487|nr:MULTISPECIES: hypothetical protein [Stenotrophomonas]OEZ02423.1 hypothetical protein BIY45_01055 [Stenotrophomonas sp. BIIR7]
MYPELWLGISLSSARLSVAIGPELTSSILCSGQLAEGYKLESTNDKDLSPVSWSITLSRSEGTTATSASFGKAFHVPDPDRSGDDDFIAAEVSVPSTQFDRILQLLTLGVGAYQLGLCLTGLTYRASPLDTTRVWRLPDTLSISEATMETDLMSEAVHSARKD